MRTYAGIPEENATLENSKVMLVSQLAIVQK